MEVHQQQVDEVTDEGRTPPYLTHEEEESNYYSEGIFCQKNVEILVVSLLRKKALICKEMIE